jgi:hypothetical protein
MDACRSGTFALGCCVLAGCSIGLGGRLGGGGGGAGGRPPSAARGDARPGARTDDGAPPAVAPPAAAASVGAAGVDEVLRERCTFGRKYSAVCYELLVAIDTAERPETVSQQHLVARSCYEQVWRAHQKVEELRADAANELILSRGQDRYAQECFRLMTWAAGGDGWRKWADQQLVLHRHMESIGDEIAEKFRARCGVAAVLDNPLDYRIVLAHASASDKVFLSVPDPGGAKVTIRCNGIVEVVGRDGAKQTVSPKTEAELYEQAAEEACVVNCARKHTACIGVPADPYTSTSVDAQRCVAACSAQCKEQF